MKTNAGVGWFRAGASTRRLWFLHEWLTAYQPHIAAPGKVPAAPVAHLAKDRRAHSEYNASMRRFIGPFSIRQTNFNPCPVWSGADIKVPAHHSYPLAHPSHTDPQWPGAIVKLF